MMVPIRYNIRSLFVRKVTTFATAFGIALVVFVYAGSLMLEEGVKRVVATGGRDDNVIILRKGSDSELASAIGKDYINLFLAHPQVDQSAGLIGEIIIVITAERNDGSGGISNLLIRGMPEQGIAFRPEVKLVSGKLPRPNTNEVMIGRAVNGRFLDPISKEKVVIEPGKQFSVRRNRPLVVVGEFSAGGSSYESEVWGDLDAIRNASGREAVVSSVRLRLKPKDASRPHGHVDAEYDFDGYRKLIEEDKRFSMKVMREPDYLENQSQQTSGFLSTFGFIIAVMFSVAAMIGAAITMNAAVANRSREIGTLRALGFSRIAILLSFILESIVLAIMGGVIGSAFVLLLSFVSFPIINFQTFSEMVISFTATPGVFVWSLLAAMVMGILGGLAPAIRASQVSPVEAMRA